MLQNLGQRLLIAFKVIFLPQHKIGEINIKINGEIIADSPDTPVMVIEYFSNIVTVNIDSFKFRNARTLFEFKKSSSNRLGWPRN